MDFQALGVISAIIGILAAVSGILLGWTARDRSVKKEAKEEIKVSVRLASDVDYIKTAVDAIRTEQNSMQTNVTTLRCDLSRVEEMAKAAHKRLDEMVEKGR